MSRKYLNKELQYALAVAFLVMSAGALCEALPLLIESEVLLRWLRRLLYITAGVGAGIITYFATQRYVRKHRDLEARLLRVERLNATSAMAAGIVHNFRNYLGVLENLSSLFRFKKNDDGSFERAVELQKKCLLQAKATADQVLWFVKRGAEKGTTRRPLCEVLDDAVELAELLIKGKELHIKKDYGTSDEPIWVNDVSIMQCVLNLVKNAAEASSERGVVTVRADVARHKFTNEFSIIVEDNGAGIPDAQKESLFHTLESHKEDGCGLGLYTVRHLVEQEGGTVEVESSEGSGTRVSLKYLDVSASCDESVANPCTQDEDVPESVVLEATK